MRRQSNSIRLRSSGLPRSISHSRTTKNSTLTIHTSIVFFLCFSTANLFMSVCLFLLLLLNHFGFFLFLWCRDARVKIKIEDQIKKKTNNNNPLKLTCLMTVSPPSRGHFLWLFVVCCVLCVWHLALAAYAMRVEIVVWMKKWPWIDYD